jgi:hypothetical protein
VAEYPFGVVVEQYDRVVLYTDADQALDELVKVAGTGKGIALFHIYKAEEIGDVRTQKLECVLQDRRVRAALGDDSLLALAQSVGDGVHKELTVAI